MNFKAGLIFLLGPGLAFACSGTESPGNDPSPGAGGADASTGDVAGAGGSTAGAGGSSTGGAGGAQTGGGAGTQPGGAAGSAGTQPGGAAGAGGSAGAQTGGSAGSAQASAECHDANQCTLLDDCCNCMPLAPGEQAPACGVPNCYVPTCTSKGVSAVACSAGQCVLDIDCDPSHVLCNSIPPSCPKGEVAMVKGACWTGACIPAAYCPVAPSCATCDTSTSTCVVHDTQMGPQAHCVEIPGACQGHVSCSCLGDAVCTPPWDTCSDSSPVGESLHCSCPSC